MNKIFDVWITLLLIHFLLYAFGVPPIWGEVSDYLRGSALIAIHFFSAIVFVSQLSDCYKFLDWKK
jgi:hypothetical protein